MRARRHAAFLQLGKRSARASHRCRPRVTSENSSRKTKTGRAASWRLLAAAKKSKRPLRPLSKAIENRSNTTDQNQRRRKKIRLQPALSLLRNKPMQVCATLTRSKPTTSSVHCWVRPRTHSQAREPPSAKTARKRNSTFSALSPLTLTSTDW